MQRSVNATKVDEQLAHEEEMQTNRDKKKWSAKIKLDALQHFVHVEPQFRAVATNSNDVYDRYNKILIQSRNSNDIARYLSVLLLLWKSIQDYINEDQFSFLLNLSVLLNAKHRIEQYNKVFQILSLEPEFVKFGFKNFIDNSGRQYSDSKLTSSGYLVRTRAPILEAKPISEVQNLKGNILIHQTREHDGEDEEIINEYTLEQSQQMLYPNVSYTYLKNNLK